MSELNHCYVNFAQPIYIQLASIESDIPESLKKKSKMVISSSVWMILVLGKN